MYKSMMDRLWTRWKASEADLDEIRKAQELADQQAEEAVVLLAESREEGDRQRVSRSRNHYGEALEWLLTRRAT